MKLAVRESQVTSPVRELDRLQMIQTVIDGDQKSVRAAELLELTSRQVPRLVDR